MKKLCLAVLAFIAVSSGIGQKRSLDPISLVYVLSPAKGYQKDILPRQSVSIKLNNKLYSLHTIVDDNSDPGQVIPDTVYNRKQKRNEYMLKTWFAGGGTNFKAYIAGSKDAKVASLMVYAQDVDEQSPASKWRLVKAIKL